MRVLIWEYTKKYAAINNKESTIDTKFLFLTREVMSAMSHPNMQESVRDKNGSNKISITYQTTPCTATDSCIQYAIPAGANTNSSKNKFNKIKADILLARIQEGFTGMDSNSSLSFAS